MTPQQAQAPSAPTILVIDNDDRIVRAVVARLHGEGYRCVSASDGGEGLRRFALTPIHLVITDLQMPGVDGAGVVGMIRSSSDVPIIIVTGYPDEYQRAFVRTAGLSYVAKPFDTQRLLDLVALRLATAPSRLQGGTGERGARHDRERKLEAPRRCGGRGND